jgi:tetratricopeptide (TPR) repeat protein
MNFAQETLAVRDFPKAEEVALRALEEAEKFDSNDRRLGITLELLSEVYFATKRYQQCAPIMIRLLKMYKTCLGPESVDTATIMANLAVLYHSLGRLLEAEDYYDEAIDIKSAKLGTDHPEVVSITTQRDKLVNDLVVSADKKLRRSRSVSPELKRSGQFESLGRVNPSERLSAE